MASASEDQAQLALAELGGLLAATRRIAGLLDAALLAQRGAHEARLLVGTEIAAVALAEDPTLLVMRGTSGMRTAAIARCVFRAVPGWAVRSCRSGGPSRWSTTRGTMPSRAIW